MDTSTLAASSDAALIGEVKHLAVHERQATAALVIALAEFDARRLYLGEGCASLFTYCTQVLELSEHAAYHRIEAARAGRRFPLVLERLASGDISLTAIGLLSAHLTPDNCLAVLDEARHRGKREVEEIVARLRPRPDVPSSIRKVPERRTETTPVATVSSSLALARADDRTAQASVPPPRGSHARVATPAVIRPLAPARYSLQVTVSRETRDKLREAQDLLRHVVPTGDPAVILDRALTLLVSELRRARQKATTRSPKDRVTKAGAAPRPEGAAATASRTVPGPSGPGADAAPQSTRRSRHIPAAVVRAVWHRDGGQCAFVGTEGRCRERSRLELHHRVPFADGGPAVVDNLELRCAAHNRYESDMHVARCTRDAVTEQGDTDSVSEVLLPTRSGPS